MILEWYCGGANPDATCQQFNKMREDLGGLELAFKCLSNEAFENLGGPLGWCDFGFVSLEFSCLRRCIFNLMGMLTPH